jgi:hypothetical protein
MVSLLMAEKRKAGRPPGRTKESVLSVRVSKKIRTALEAAALRNKRRLSREAEDLLDYALQRHQLPSRLMALSDTVVIVARIIEEETEQSWNEDRYTSEHLAKAIGRVIAALTRPGKVIIPPEVIKKAKDPAHLGEEKAEGIIGLLKLPTEWRGARVPEVFLWVRKIQHDLARKRK